MTSPTPAVAVFATAAVVSAAGAGMEAPQIQYGAEIVAMLALSAGAALTGRHHALRLFGVLLAGAALTDLAATWLSYPDPAPRGANGCPTADEAVIGYWTGRLRLEQVAAALRFGALICVTVAVSALPTRPGLSRWQRPALITLASIPAVLIGLYPVYAADDHAELLRPTMPAILTLATAVALTVLTATHTPGGRARTTALLSGAILMLVPALSAVEKVATPVSQIQFLSREPDSGVFMMCAYSYATATPDLSTVAVTAGTTLLFLAAPALLLWAAPRAS